MRRRKKRTKPVIFENVEIFETASEGKTIAKIEHLVVFVNKVLPGDIVDIKVFRKKKNYFEAYPIKFHKYSEHRVEQECVHFGICGGCKWRNFDYEKQLFYKQKQVSDNFERIGKVKVSKINPILRAEELNFSRNKLEYTFSNRKWLTEVETKIDGPKQVNALGFHIPRMFDRIVDIDYCYLQKDPSNNIRNKIRDYAIENNMGFFDTRKHGGLLRNLIIRTSSTGDLMVILSFGANEKENIFKLLDYINIEFPEITSLNYVINTKGNDTLFDLNIICYKGNEFIYEQMGDLKFKIGPKSFYQTNAKQAYNLYKIAEEYAKLTGAEIVYDLYTGTGTIANFIARKAKKVIGIDNVPEAIDDAIENSKINNIENTEFYAGNIKDVITKDFFEQKGKPDIIIIDPPRAGIHKQVTYSLLNSNAKKIIYISCNPATQARDVNILSEKYEVIEYTPVDMFPHTHHVENIALLKLKGEE